MGEKDAAIAQTKARKGCRAVNIIQRKVRPGEITITAVQNFGIGIRLHNLHQLVGMYVFCCRACTDQGCMSWNVPGMPLKASGVRRDDTQLSMAYLGGHDAFMCPPTSHSSFRHKCKPLAAATYQQQEVHIFWGCCMFWGC